MQSPLRAGGTAMSDFSCYITITNNSGHALGIATPPPEDGSWVGAPTSIKAHSSASFQLKDPSGPEGSEGGFVAMAVGTEAMLMANFQDGYVQSNYCNISAQGLTETMSWSFEGASDEPSNWEQGGVPGGGHPVYLNFTFTDTEPMPPAAAGSEGATPA